MRKWMLYPRLAAGNLVRNRGTYLPYLLACLVSVFTFYTLVAINDNPGMEKIPGAELVQSVAAMGVVIMGLFAMVLLLYTNSFLIKRRKKELGLYSILGMEKRNIGLVMFYETVIMAAAAIVGGIALGMLLSQLVFAALLRLIRFPVVYTVPVSWPAASLTAVFFLVVFGIILLANLRQVAKSDPVQLLSGAKQGEKEPKASILITVLGLASLGAGYWIAIATEEPLSAILLFLPAVGLVIVGTYCLFISGSVAVLKLLRRNKKIYYHPRRFIAISGMIYRMKQNAAGLASICILSCMVLVTVSSTVSLYAGSKEMLDSKFPSDYRVTLRGETSKTEFETEAAQLAQKHGVEIAWGKSHRYGVLGLVGENGAYSPAAANEAPDVVFQLITVEDFNTQENSNYQLNPGQVLIGNGRNIAKWTGERLALNGAEFAASLVQARNDLYFGVLDGYILVVDSQETLNSILQQVGDPSEAGGMVRHLVMFDLAGSPQGIQDFLAGLEVQLEKAGQNSYIESRAQMEETWYALYGSFLFLGVYFGILFMMAAVMIIYYKQISEGLDDAHRFDIMQKVGMSHQEVWNAIRFQIVAVFFLPLAVAGIHMLAAYPSISRAMVVFGLTNTTVFAVSMAVSLVVYALIYLLVYRRTARAYYKIVKREE